LFKISYTGSFLVTLPCTLIISPKLVHLLYFTSFYLSPLLRVTSTGLKILYSSLYREYIKHIHLLNFLLLHFPLPMWLPLSVTCFSWYCCICVRSPTNVAGKNE
jgi:hypothetical protein